MYAELVDNDSILAQDIISSSSGKREDFAYYKVNPLLTQQLNFFSKLPYYFKKSKETKEHSFRVVRNDKKYYPPVLTSNKVDNTRYNFLTFLPKFLFNQFKYFFNFYYLLLCISQLIPPLKIGIQDITRFYLHIRSSASICYLNFASKRN